MFLFTPGILQENFNLRFKTLNLFTVNIFPAL
jgi:hypothetical protein